MSLTGLLFGAGASYDNGMPTAAELTKDLKNWLTSCKLRELNDQWRMQGSGYSEATIDDLASVLNIESMGYEHIVGYLEVQRTRIRERSHEYHGLLAFLSEIIYFLLLERHVLNRDFIERSAGYLESIKELVQANNPLWIFSLNHDLIVECFSAYAGIRVSYGSGREIVRLPRRDLNGTAIGNITARVTRKEQFATHALSFLEPGERGINLMKLHGSLDEFAFNDGKDILKLLPGEDSVSGILSVLEIANEQVRYIDPRWPGSGANIRCCGN